MKLGHRRVEMEMKVNALIMRHLVVISISTRFRL